MKNCPNCNAQLNDNALFCSSCGQNLSGQVTPASPFDHSARFDKQDISDNKVYAMLVYLLGVVGLLIALLAANKSPYVSFHIRQSLKITVAETLMWIAAVLVSITIIFAFVALPAALIMSGVLMVIRVICFFQICSDKAIEPAIIRSLPFLK